MAILTFPDLDPCKATWKLQSNTEKYTSPLNGSTQTTERPGSRWKAVLEFDDMTLARTAVLDAWLASLNGMAGRFYLHPHHRPGTAGVGVVSAVSARTVSASGIILGVGDFIEAGGELKMITSAGNPMSISPPWRRQPAVGAAINATMPLTIMMLESDEYAVTRVPGLMYENITISCVEVFA